MTDSLFSRTMQTDVIAVLMLLGESTLWKAVWERVRSRRCHWRHWVFAISPGWAPLAASTLAALGAATGIDGPNLVFDRAPKGVIDHGLVLTNLKSGASHTAETVPSQNIWNAWCRGPRKQSRHLKHFKGKRPSVTREVGLVDLNLDKLIIEREWPFWIQAACLLTQLSGALTLAFQGWGFEVFIVVCEGLIGQSLLLLAVTPGKPAWHMPV